MANSVIDYVQNGGSPNKSGKKGLKVVIFLMLFLLIILLVAFGVLIYFKKQNKVTTKDLFIQYLGKSNFSSVLNLEKFNDLTEKLESEDSETNTEISAEVSDTLQLTDDFDISDFLIQIDSKKKPDENKLFANSIIKYKDDDIIDFQVLSQDEKLAVISEEILIKYIGSKYSDLDRVISEFLSSEDTNAKLDFDFSLLKNSKLKVPEIPIEILKKYSDVISQKIPETAFSTKNVTLERDSGSINVTEYAMTINEELGIELLDQLLKTFETDDDLLDLLLSSINDEDVVEDLKENIKSRN